jgi:antitoxin FitA
MVAIQVRDVPERVRSVLASEAERRGQSLQVFLADVLEREAASARNRALLRELVDRPIATVTGDIDVVELIARQREERTNAILGASGRPHDPRAD